MAIKVNLWQEKQERDARREMRLVVADAVIRYNPPCNNRQPFWRLHRAAGIGGMRSIRSRALCVELAEVSNGQDKL